MHALRSSHVSSLTTNCYFSSDTTYYTNAAHHTKSIVRECNPVTGFTIKERINRNTETTLQKSYKAKPDWKALVIIPMQFQFNSIRTEKLPVNDKEVFAAHQKVQIMSDFLGFLTLSIYSTAQPLNGTKVWPWVCSIPPDNNLSRWCGMMARYFSLNIHSPFLLPLNLKLLWTNTMSYKMVL